MIIDLPRGGQIVETSCGFI